MREQDPTGQGAEDLVRFRIVRRGFDQAEVGAALSRLGAELTAARSEADALRAELAGLRSGELDEAAVVERLGEETARVLRAAREAAHRLRSKAEAEAQAILADAEREASEARAEAASVLASRSEVAQAEADRVLEAAGKEAERLLAEARLDAEELLREAVREREAASKALVELQATREGLLGSFRTAAALVAQAEAALGAPADLEGPRPGADGGSASSAELAGSLPAQGEEEGPPNEREPALEGRGGALSPVTRSPEAQAEGIPEPLGRPVAAEEALADEDGEAPGAMGGESSLAASVGEEAPPQPVGAGDGPEVPVANGGGSAALYAGIKAERVGKRGSRTRAGGDQALGAGRRGARATSQTRDASPDSGSGGAWMVSSLVARPAAWPDLMEPAGAALGRKLKRALQDRQNAWLDKLRQGGPGGISAEDLLQDEAHYRAAVAGPLEEAWESALSSWGGADFVATSRSKMVEEAAATLALAAAEGVASASEPGTRYEGSQEGTEALSNAFRQWRARHLPVAVGDAVLAVFAAAFVACMPGGMRLRWVPSEGSRCPACTSNAVVAPRPAGDEFPSGHLHPPAHPGCRCVLLPLPT